MTLTTTNDQITQEIRHLEADQRGLAEEIQALQAKYVAIFHANNGKLKWNGGGHRAVWTHNIDSSGVHPTAKPQSLCKELLGLFAIEGTLVLDPFAGSGTTLVAAKQLGLRSIGIELEEKYCEIAVQRLRQKSLFTALDATPQPERKAEQVSLLEALS